ncbi:hypothetical protein EK21DRAFT_100626 [Setomelanomma holmii]|uniref:Uncharacterized protein n=1 Tax=Setomelanomma holmii TaxID=210430 RepID=A0A9P4LN09_9PLEO|nr:hypothetical protein EK21DRAFT_100626 [Setomelanomma holmii]
MVTTRRKAAELSEAASPLKSLEVAPRTRKATKNKRKRNAATPEPAADKSDEEGLFFQQIPQDPTQMIAERDAEILRLREEVLGLRNLISSLYYRLNLAEQAKGHRANLAQPTTDYDSFMGNTVEPTPVRAEFISGNKSAFELLHHIESAAREPRTFHSESDGEVAASQPAQSSPQADARTEQPSNIATATPSPRAISQPTGFFSRSFSALKSKLGFSTSTPPEPAPTPSRAPPPDTITETLSAPPTPVGERKKATHKKKQSPMMRLLTKGVEPSDIKQAEEWAKHVIPALKNDADFNAKRSRLATSVLVKDLTNFPSSKPWETGFGDPLGDLDDEDTVPVWAVYLDILAEEEQPRKKKTKTSHQETMDVDDTLSLNDMFADSSSPTPSPRLHDSHGNSASLHDLHPRRSVEPSPMFGSPLAHKQGNNIFRERQGQEATEQLRANDRDALHKATKKAIPNHDPSQGSFGLDSDSDEEDTTISETADDSAAAPVWTQPPPPAPTPAHAPLPGASANDSATAPNSQQPVDEVERQRQKLMKHTPAKPSRLREAFVPSPSLLSSAGNESIFLASPIPATDLFDDMPDAEDLGLDEDCLAEIERITNTEEYKAEIAREWPDAILTYDSDEEDLSPI